MGFFNIYLLENLFQLSLDVAIPHWCWNVGDNPIPGYVYKDDSCASKAAFCSHLYLVFTAVKVMAMVPHFERLFCYYLGYTEIEHCSFEINLPMEMPTTVMRWEPKLIELFCFESMCRQALLLQSIPTHWKKWTKFRDWSFFCGNLFCSWFKFGNIYGWKSSSLLVFTREIKDIKDQNSLICLYRYCLCLYVFFCGLQMFLCFCNILL